jgi:hypothetical protein
LKKKESNFGKKKEKKMRKLGKNDKKIRRGMRVWRNSDSSHHLDIN